jgi:hypothetical protein
MKEFYATHPHLKPSDENADKPLNSRPAPSAATPKPPQPAPKSANSTPQPPPAKKQPYPTQKEFDQDINALTRKHFFPNIPDEIYKKAMEKK